MGNRANIVLVDHDGWQLRYCGSAITAPAMDIDSGIAEAQAWLRERVFQSYADSPAGRVAGLVALFDAEDIPVPQVSTSALEYAGERPSAAE